MEVINEGSSITLTISFKDSDDTPVTPLSMDYKIYDKASNTVLDSDSVVPLTTSYDLEVLGTINSMVDENARSETRQVVISWEYNNDQTDVFEYSYKIKNIKGV